MTFLSASQALHGTLEALPNPDSGELLVILDDNPGDPSGRLFCPASNGVVTFEGTLSELYAGAFRFTPVSSSLKQRRRNERIKVKLSGELSSHEETLNFESVDLSALGMKLSLEDSPQEALLPGENIALQLNLSERETIALKGRIESIEGLKVRVRFCDTPESDKDRLHLFILIESEKR